jgi:peroxiredoxin
MRSPPFAPYLWLAAFLVVLALPGLAEGPGLRDLSSGQPATLDDHLGKGQWTVVMFWSSDCPICNREAPAWSLFDARHRARDARVVGVSLDGERRLQEAKAFVDRHLLDFPSLIGAPGEVGRLYSERGRSPFLGTPSFLVFGPDGQLRARQVGPLPVDRLEQLIQREGQGKG